MKYLKKTIVVFILLLMVITGVVTYINSKLFSKDIQGIIKSLNLDIKVGDAKFVGYGKIKVTGLVLYDKEKDFTISVTNMHSDYDHTIWEGKKLHGYPTQTYLRGNLVYDNGEFVGTPGTGKYIKRSTR